MSFFTTSSFALSLTAVCVFTQSGCLMSLKNDSIELPSQMTKPTAINNIRQINDAQFSSKMRPGANWPKNGAGELIDKRSLDPNKIQLKKSVLFEGGPDSLPTSISNNDNPVELKPRQQPTNDQNNASQ